MGCCTRSVRRIVGVLAIGLTMAQVVHAQGSWTARDLGALGGRGGWANDINDAGQVVGSANLASGSGRAFLWTAAGGMVNLGALGGDLSYASAINDAGQVVGTSEYGTCAPWPCSPFQQAFLWTAAGGMVDLGTLGGDQSGASGINDLGHVVGTSTTASGQTHAFLWTPAGGMVAPYGTLGGEDTLAYDINDVGQVVGRSLVVSGDRHPFVWTAAEGMTDLGTLGGNVGFAYAINEVGQVVGRSESVPDGPQTATLWANDAEPPTPEEQIDALMVTIGALVSDGSLRAGQANGLTRPLRNASRSLASGHLASACSQLHDFEVEVTRKVLDGALTTEDGTALIDAAERIRRDLGC